MATSVSRLEVASQAVRLESGLVLDGMTNGNIDTPAVRITPASAIDDDTKAASPRDRPASHMPARVASTATPGMANVKG